jgi:hypothetical protein
MICVVEADWDEGRFCDLRSGWEKEEGEKMVEVMIFVVEADGDKGRLCDLKSGWEKEEGGKMVEEDEGRWLRANA